MTKLLIVRHGNTQFNTDKRFCGQTDAELNDKGLKQVEKLQKRLAGEKIDTVFSSDLKRAFTTAGTITKGMNIEIIGCPELREFNYGVCEGMTFTEITQQCPDVAEKIRDLSPDLTFPEGESFNDFVARVGGFRARLAGRDAETVLIVAHSGSLQVLLCHLLGIPAAHWWQLRLEHASLSVIDIYPRGAILSLLNDVSHLDGKE